MTMAKRKSNDNKDDSATTAQVRRQRTTLSLEQQTVVDDEHPRQVLDLRDVLISSPKDLKEYLEQQSCLTGNDSSLADIKGGKAIITSWSIFTSRFPRGCMQVLLDYVVNTQDNSDDKNINRIVKFQNYYGKVYKYHLQNPDLKLLIKSQGEFLTQLQMTPQQQQQNSGSEERSQSSTPPSPKLEGCGYRWITVHAIRLEVLEISLKYDTKRQLLDLSKKNPLQTQNLRTLVLRYVRSIDTTIRQQLNDLVRQSPNLQHLKLYVLADGGEADEDNTEEEDLTTLLRATSIEAGNKDLQVEIF